MNAWSVPGYREVRELGAGGAGRVVLATYVTTGAYVAIKYLREELRRDRRFLAGFRHEARVMVELSDPGIVRLYEYVEARDGAAIVMELVDGVSLRRILAEHGSTSPEAALVVLKGSLSGLSAAHSAGIVHRDYKPENVLIQADGTSKLSDFGIATPSGSAEAPAGTPPYMAPEQWYGGLAGPAADVYAATCVFYECLTGRRPYRADDLTALRMLHRGAPIPAADVPGSVRNLITRGMAKNPADRPPTARAFISDLETAATAAYGPDWEQRGRRHLAELATLLALTFPLAAPAEPVEASTSLAQTVLAERLARFAPRLVIGAAVLSAIVIAAVVAANRQTPVARDTLLTPPPHSALAVPPPAAGPPAAVVPEADVPADVPAGDVPAADVPPDENVGTTPPEPSGTPVSTGEATPPDPSDPSEPPGSSEPAVTPSHMGATASPGPVRVTGLGIAAFDGQAVTVDVGAGTTARVLLTARFASGPSPDALAATAPQTVALRGATSYHIGLQQPFPSPACGTTVYRQVRVSTVPAARGGTRTRTEKLTGAPCPAPAVEGVEIDAWDGTTAVVGVRSATKDPVDLHVAFVRRVTYAGRTSTARDAEDRTLSGSRRYAERFTATFGAPRGAPRCGYVEVRSVSVTASPGGTTRSATRTVTGPRCPEPQGSPSGASGSGPGKESPSPPTTPDPRESPSSGPPRSPAPDNPGSGGPRPDDPRPDDPGPRNPGRQSPDPQDSPPPPVIT
ncbi:serine/threonine-protein kinase [Microbispora sp. NPDC088329]|uniref:serine/threonine-protein kinase n=1 Tax=Microbispora sp. NPDC088329 TaxID=3154869 RepID=UPI0034234057